MSLSYHPLTLYHPSILSTTYPFIYLPDHSLTLSSTYPFIHLPFHPLTLLSTYPFIHLPFHPLTLSSTHSIPLLYFYQATISSTHPSTHPLCHPPINLSTDAIIYSSSHPPTLLSTHPFFHSPIHLFTRSSTKPSSNIWYLRTWSSFRFHLGGMSSSASLIILHQLEDKLKAHNFLVDFLKGVSIWDKVTGGEIDTIQNFNMSHFNMLVDLDVIFFSI